MRLAVLVLLSTWFLRGDFQRIGLLLWSRVVQISLVSRLDIYSLKVDVSGTMLPAHLENRRDPGLWWLCSAGLVYNSERAVRLGRFCRGCLPRSPMFVVVFLVACAFH